YVISATADNPFIDAPSADAMIRHHIEQGHDFTSMVGKLPFGTFSYGVTVDAMQRASTLAATKDTEVWGPYFTETGRFRCGTFTDIAPELVWPDLRLTVDTPADFELVTRIFEALYVPGEVFSLQDIVALCRAHPEWVAINSGVIQKTPQPIALNDD